MNISEIRSRVVNFRLTQAEYDKLMKDMGRFGTENISFYIKKKVFEQPLYVITKNPDTHKYYATLTELFRQFRSPGNNYNQDVKLFYAAKTTDGMYRLMVRLKELTVALMTVGEKILKLTIDYKDQWLQK